MPAIARPLSLGVGANGYPFSDIDADGSVAGVIAAADGIVGLANDNTPTIPGHGKATETAGLK